VLITRGIEKTAKALVAELKLMSKEVKPFSCLFFCVSVFKHFYYTCYGYLKLPTFLLILVCSLLSNYFLIPMKHKRLWDYIA